MKADTEDIIIDGSKTIIDIRNELPKQPNRSFRRRKLDSITGIVVHHSASPKGMHTPFDFARWHMNGSMKAPGICYHIAISGKEIYWTSDFENIVWHSGNANGFTIGVEIDGNYEIETPDEDSLSSLRWVIGYIENFLGRTLTVEGHQKYMATACPGKNMMALKDKWKYKIK